MTTFLTRPLDIQSPILAAPMAFASTADLAAAVTKAGGYGLVGAGKLTLSILTRNGILNMFQHRFRLLREAQGNPSIGTQDIEALG